MSTTHTFNKAAKETMDKSIAICEQRAGEYQDSWALENLRTPYLESVMHYWDSAGATWGNDLQILSFKRLLIMASMCDIKLSRMGGPFKEDTYIDLNNYNSAFCTLRREFEELLQGIEKPTTPTLICDKCLQKCSSRSGTGGMMICDACWDKQLHGESPTP